MQIVTFKCILYLEWSWIERISVLSEFCFPAWFCFRVLISVVLEQSGRCRPSGREQDMMPRIAVTMLCDRQCVS